MILKMPNRQYRLDETRIEKQKIVDSMQIEMSNAAAQKKLLLINLQTAYNDYNRNGERAGVELQRSSGAGVGAVTGAIISKKKGETIIGVLQAQE
jgi:hypothetical protein